MRLSRGAKAEGRNEDAGSTYCRLALVTLSKKRSEK
jgi:hypothetical protein